MFVLILFHFHLLVAAGGTNDTEAKANGRRLGHKVSPLPLFGFYWRRRSRAFGIDNGRPFLINYTFYLYHKQ